MNLNEKKKIKKVESCSFFPSFSDVSLGFQYEPGGTTAVVVLVKDKQIFCVRSLVSICPGLSADFVHQHHL